MMTHEQFVDQAAMFFAAARHPGSEPKEAFDKAERLAAERTRRRTTEGLVLNNYEAESLREAIDALGEGELRLFWQAFSDAMKRREVTRVGVDVALQRIMGK